MKNGLGQSLGDSFTNSPGHPARNKKQQHFVSIPCLFTSKNSFKYIPFFSSGEKNGDRNVKSLRHLVLKFSSEVAEKLIEIRPHFSHTKKKQTDFSLEDEDF
jgi:hypothetical protein